MKKRETAGDVAPDSGRAMIGVQPTAIVIPCLSMWFSCIIFWPWGGPALSLLIVPALLAIPSISLALLIESASKAGAYVSHPLVSILGNVLCISALWCLGASTEPGHCLDFMIPSGGWVMFLGIPLTVVVGCGAFLLPGLIAAGNQKRQLSR